MIYKDQLVYVDAIFQVMLEADHDDAFLWRPAGSGRQREWRAFARCNDLFFWGAADAEVVRPEDVPLLQRTLADLQAIEKANPYNRDQPGKSWSVATAWLPELYAARKRGMRPQGAFYATRDLKHEPMEVARLFDAAGPERDDLDGKKHTVFDGEAEVKT